MTYMLYKMFHNKLIHNNYEKKKIKEVQYIRLERIRITYLLFYITIRFKHHREVKGQGRFQNTGSCATANHKFTRIF